MQKVSSHWLGWSLEPHLGRRHRSMWLEPIVNAFMLRMHVTHRPSRVLFYFEGTWENRTSWSTHLVGMRRIWLSQCKFSNCTRKQTLALFANTHWGVSTLVTQCLKFTPEILHKSGWSNFESLFKSSVCEVYVHDPQKKHGPNGGNVHFVSQHRADVVLSPRLMASDDRQHTAHS